MRCAPNPAPLCLLCRLGVRVACLCAGRSGFRTEWYNKMTVATAPKYEAYTNAVLFAEDPDGDL